MKKILTYTILAACILALSACSHKQLDPPVPEIEVDETASINFTTGVAGTKSLIGNNTADGEVALENSNTIIQVYDYLTSTDGNTTVEYIKDKISGVANPNPWNYIDVNTHYYWTKTGTHKFFGWLTEQGEKSGETTTTIKATDLFGANFKPENNWDTSTQTLTIPSTTMTPAVSTDTPPQFITPQFDFLYSDIKSYKMPNRPTTTNKAVNLQMHHLFTALAVQIVNESGVALNNFTVQFTNVHPTQSATINWGKPDSDDETLPTVICTPGTAAPMDLGKTNVGKPATTGGSTTASLYTGYVLLWPQDIAETSMVIVNYDELPKEITKGMRAVFNGLEKLVAETKYLLTITVKPNDMIFDVRVDPLVEHYYGEEGYNDYQIKF